MLLSNIEYVALRLIRRFLVPSALLSAACRVLPYWRRSENETDPAPVVDKYTRHLSSVEGQFRNRRIVEIGVGATSSTCYEMVARGASLVTGVEPVARFAPARDAGLLDRTARRYGIAAGLLRDRVRRVDGLGSLADGCADIILSHSVLEHVADPRGLFTGLCRVLEPRGVMVHIVDYRDHFFKYPYHLLQFRRRTWARFLDPGDLPGWRLGDHLRVLGELGLHVRMLDQEVDGEAFARIRDHITPDFDRHDPRIAVGKCAFAVRREPWPADTGAPA